MELLGGGGGKQIPIEIATGKKQKSLNLVSVVIATLCIIDEHEVKCFGINISDSEIL